jgi:hypothetical protein
MLSYFLRKSSPSRRRQSLTSRQGSYYWDIGMTIWDRGKSFENGKNLLKICELDQWGIVGEYLGNRGMSLTITLFPVNAYS